MAKKVETTILQLPNMTPYEKNLEEILRWLERRPDSDLIVAPEVCLTDYDYENIDDAVKFGDYAEERLLSECGERILALTRLARRDGRYVNEAIVMHRGEVIHRRAKHKLFLLGEEDRYLQAGDAESIVPFEIDGVKYGLLICFELRYKELWKRLEGCDIVLLPSQWGIARKRHLEILSSALAIMNQCFVVTANSSKEDMASSSAISSPNGGVVMEDFSTVIDGTIDLNLSKKIRRYIRM